jgi:hypothetical protein
MKRLFYVSRLRGVSEGFPVTTTHPNGSKVAPQILLGYWWLFRRENFSEWRYTGEIMQIEPGIELQVGAAGELVAKTGVIKREINGLRLCKNKRSEQHRSYRLVRQQRRPRAFLHQFRDA